MSKKARSAQMSLVKSHNTKPELLVRKFLHSQGMRFRLHKKDLPGKPDIVLSKYRAVVFVHGCFWHGHNSKECRLARTPKSNIEFWRNKVLMNRKRDVKNLRLLKKADWRVFVVYECQINKKDDAILKKLIKQITL